MSKTVLWKSNFKMDGTKIFSVTRRSKGGKELSFCTRGSSSGLCFRAIQNNAKVQEKSRASHRTTMMKVLGVSSINKADQPARFSGTRKSGSREGLPTQYLAARET